MSLKEIRELWEVFHEDVKRSPVIVLSALLIVGSLWFIGLYYVPRAIQNSQHEIERETIKLFMYEVTRGTLISEYRMRQYVASKEQSYLTQKQDSVGFVYFTRSRMAEVEKEARRFRDTESLLKSAVYPEDLYSIVEQHTRGGN